MLSSSALASLSAGCLRLTESSEGTSTDPTGQSPAQAGSETGTGSDDDDEMGLTESWTIERNIRLWNDVAATATGEGLLYFTTYSTEYENNGSVVAVDVQDGTTEWEYDKPAEVIFQLEYVDGQLYMLDADGALRVLDAATGTQNWASEVPYSSKSGDDEPLWPGNISVGPERVVVSLLDINSEEGYTYIYAVNKSEQRVDWEIQHETIEEHSEYSYLSPEGLSPIVDGTVYVAFNRATISVDVQDGTINWSQDNFPASGPVSVADDVIVMPGGSFLQILDRASGDSLWSVEGTAPQGPSFISEPVIADGRVYATARDTEVYAVDLQGETTIWTGETGGEIRVGPVVTDTAVWAGSRDGRVYAFEKESGAKLTSELIGSPIVGFEYASGTLLLLTGESVGAFVTE